MKFIDLTGQKFGRLTVIERVKNDKYEKSKWSCVCECDGKEVIVRTQELRSGNTKSCGCFRIQRIKEAQTTHNMYNTTLYKIWRGMIGRCYIKTNTSYKYYGEKGISVYEEWKGKNGFITFYNWCINNGYEKGLTIDRIECSKNYEPENCRWTTTAVQSINKGMFSSNKSGYKGVHLDKQNNKWRVGIAADNKAHYIGMYSNIENAIEARRQAELKYHQPILQNA